MCIFDFTCQPLAGSRAVDNPSAKVGNLGFCIKLPYPAPKAPNNLKAQDGSNIRGGTLIFDACFFASTSADQQRRSYKKLNDVVHVTVESLVQEADLEFDREGMHDRILGDASHLKIMRHNFSNVVT